MHALRRIHRSLQPGGLLVDLHPQPEPPAVEVWQGSRVERIGHVDEHDDMRGIREARRRLARMEAGGWYVTLRQEFFDLIAHFPSTRAWEQYKIDEGDSASLAPETLARADELMTTGGGEFIVREPIRASLLERLPRGGNRPETGRGGRGRPV